ncbi:putative uncharacterized protein DDB_G0271606 [Lucilia cuprina]|uniref:putative uncharacterized protein DDB_G0271606 n=1 Tax=Lucilia cuprina TaxID=7375 RepID=UPI001F067A75|nr:putative uncharacterized protein DDB_G0271606 [Lucilia cuprina]
MIFTHGNSNNNNNTWSSNGPHIAEDRMPRRRKRHFSKMNLMLMIFVSCCLILIISPVVKAKESNNNNATAKGENMLNTEGNNWTGGVVEQNKDKTNDKNTFKRLKSTDFNDDDDNVDNTEEEEDSEDEEEHSSEVIEMIQPAHNLRHQEHYKQRILMAEKDFQLKQKQQQQQQPRQQQKNQKKENAHDDDVDDEEDYDGDDEAIEQERESLSLHNRNLRYQQIQLALREPMTSSTTPTPPHHHRRHEHHLAKQRLAKQPIYNTWPTQQQQQHHLRHQHHHLTQDSQHHNQQQQQQQPQLHHLKPQIRKQNLTHNNQQPLYQRYFDRESSYMNPSPRLMTTEGPPPQPPHLRHTGAGTNKYWKSMQYSNNPHNRLYNDAEVATSHNNQPKEEDIKRISLSLDEHDESENDNENEKANKSKEPQQTLDETAKYEDTDIEDVNSNDNTDTDATTSNEDDYSYEDDNDDDKEINKSPKYPTIQAYAKTNVKRYTNPLRPLYKTSSSASYSYRPTQHNYHLRHAPQLMKTSNGNNGDDYDDTDNYEDDITSDESTTSNNDDDDDDKFSDEKWNKIEHEHYRKQLQHQRAMQALRSRRPTSNLNNQHSSNTNNNNNNKYSSYSPAAAAAAAAWTKRQTMNDDETDNIYARSYVPGTVTRKKEEELGSPAAILESRRQYALQQRQNKALASAHHRRIVTEGSCRLPQPRVERIRRDSWKIYTPHCTILHRCADDAGCCPSERQTCAPKRTKNVDLYFFVISLNETQGSIEKLTFVNHTECHCVNRSKQRAPEYASSGAKELIANNQIPYLRRATILNCYCPNLFEKILQEDGFCRCDCSSGNMGCDWLKRGMEHFSMNDRKCILEGRCKLPTCEYGQYIKKHGRCPRREERHLSSDVDW